jgi:hypothetical protein
VTTSIYPDRAVRRRRFHLHCSCGATIASNEPTATCNECGSIVSYRRASLLKADSIAIIRSVGKEIVPIIGWPVIVALVGYLAGIGGAILAVIASLIAFGMRKTDFSRARRTVQMSPDPNMRYRWIGRVFLVLAIFLALGYSVPGSNYQEWLAVAKHPRPRNCDFAAWPFGDKHCHYEPSFNPSSEGGEKLTVNWNWVSD